EMRAMVKAARMRRSQVGMGFSGRGGRAPGPGRAGARRGVGVVSGGRCRARRRRCGRRAGCPRGPWAFRSRSLAGLRAGHGAALLRVRLRGLPKSVDGVAVVGVAHRGLASVEPELRAVAGPGAQLAGAGGAQVAAGAALPGARLVEDIGGGAADGEVSGDDALGPRCGAGRLVGGADTVFHGCSSWLSRWDGWPRPGSHTPTGAVLLERSEVGPPSRCVGHYTRVGFYTRR